MIFDLLPHSPARPALGPDTWLAAVACLIAVGRRRDSGVHTSGLSRLAA
jgi:hypothetical protein